MIVARPTFYDRSAMLQLSLDFQEKALYHDEFDTVVFVDSHPLYGYVDDYDRVITKKLQRINWSTNAGKYSWYDSVKYLFDNTHTNYVLSIEDDIIISQDYFKLCKQLIQDNILSDNNNILYFHAGAWEQPKGDVNKIVRSQASTRSCLIHRYKFDTYIRPYYQTLNDSQLGLDLDLQNILEFNHMTTIAPQYNRHGHFGVYGWSSSGADRNAGQKAIFEHTLDHDTMYKLLQHSCLSKELLIKLNHNKNPHYFWNFNPNINFTKIEYVL